METTVETKKLTLRCQFCEHVEPHRRGARGRPAEMRQVR